MSNGSRANDRRLSQLNPVFDGRIQQWGRGDYGCD
jgi:hypothetical protein